MSRAAPSEPRTERNGALAEWSGVSGPGTGCRFQSLSDGKSNAAYSAPPR